jgi:hypothetical protein
LYIGRYKPAYVFCADCDAVLALKGVNGGKV